jgi:hypothetical protein
MMNRFSVRELDHRHALLSQVDLEGRAHERLEIL